MYHLKDALFILNIVTMIVAMTIIGLASSVIEEFKEIRTFKGCQVQNGKLIILTMSGVGIVIMCLIACCAVSRRSSIMLCIYIICVVALVVVQVGLAKYILANKPTQADWDEFENEFQTKIIRMYKTDPWILDIYTRLGIKMFCCGYNSAGDFLWTPYNYYCSTGIPCYHRFKNYVIHYEEKLCLNVLRFCAGQLLGPLGAIALVIYNITQKIKQKKSAGNSVQGKKGANV